jgi:hypothetical protein
MLITKNYWLIPGINQLAWFDPDLLTFKKSSFYPGGFLIE